MDSSWRAEPSPSVTQPYKGAEQQAHTNLPNYSLEVKLYLDVTFAAPNYNPCQQGCIGGVHSSVFYGHEVILNGVILPRAITAHP